MPQHSSSSTWCKICGITTLEDAQLSQTAGADALGFNCYAQSPRYVAPERLAELTASVNVTRVALFVDAPAAAVEQVLRVAQIDMLQFQGSESEAYCAGFGLPYMKGVRMAADVDVAAEAGNFGSAWGLLLDAYVPGKPGGTGQSFDWTRWPDVPDVRLILAGGLTPANVAAAISRLQPFGVDVCGGVEGPEKGRKDSRKVNEFMQEVCSVGR